MYLLVSGDPSLIEMNSVKFEENSANKRGNTLYVVWKSTSNMDSTQFSSFVSGSEEMYGEGEVERWNGDIVELEEFVNGGGSREEGSGSEGEEKKNRYTVSTWIEKEGKLGKVIVAVGEEEEEGSEGEVNGEGVVMNMEKELKNLLEQCDEIEIVMNVTYGLSNG